MKHVYPFEVRGYELDSLNHVNNAVYLNYFEAARWKMLNEKSFNGVKWLVHAKNLDLDSVVVETNIRYIRELKLFDEAVVESDWRCDGNYLIFDQVIYKEKKRVKVAKATVKMIFVTSDRLVSDIPNFIKENLVSCESRDAYEKS